ncbi:MAG TPA: hypothetical protein VGK53_08545 [Propionicimonas sp.]|jgi:hypothetical protein
MTAEKSLPHQHWPAQPGSVAARYPAIHELAEGDRDLQTLTSAARDLAHSDLVVHVGISLASGGRPPETLAATSDVPVRADWLQHGVRQGPGMWQARDEVLVSKDLAADERWPDFGKLCVAVLDLRSMVSVRIRVPGAALARLNFYATEPVALEQLDVGSAVRLAQLADTPVSRALERLRDDIIEPERGDPNRVALALGTIMARYRVNSAQAFELLLYASDGGDRNLVDAALEVVDIGGLPGEVLHAARQRHQERSLTEREPGQTAPRAWLRNDASQARVHTDRGVPHTGASRSLDTPTDPDRRLCIGGPEMWRAPTIEPPLTGRRGGTTWQN